MYLLLYDIYLMKTSTVHTKKKITMAKVIKKKKEKKIDSSSFLDH